MKKSLQANFKIKALELSKETCITRLILYLGLIIRNFILFNIKFVKFPKDNILFR